MKIKLAFLGILITLLLSSTMNAQSPEWLLQIENIKLLQDTRADIIKLFGEPTHKNTEYSTSYRYNDYQIYIEYSRGLCETTKVEDWNVPEFTVVNVYVYIFKKIRPKDIKLKIKQLPGKEIYDVPKAYKY